MPTKFVREWNVYRGDSDLIEFVIIVKKEEELKRSLEEKNSQIYIRRSQVSHTWRFTSRLTRILPCNSYHERKILDIPLDRFRENSFDQVTCMYLCYPVTKRQPGMPWIITLSLSSLPVLLQVSRDSKVILKLTKKTILRRFYWLKE